MKRRTVGEHLHTIKLEELIVHRYADHDILFKKADKVARALIEGELRDGEGVRVPKPGVYELFFPKLKPDAGALRCSVIAEQVAREVKQINPASMAVQRSVQHKPSADVSDNRPRANSRRPASAPMDVNDAAQRVAANRALAFMAEAVATTEINMTEEERRSLGSLEIAFHPVWYTKNNLITGYFCELRREGEPVAAQDIEGLNANSQEVAIAKLDTAMYKAAAKAVHYLLQEEIKALLIVPLHFSTVDRLRFIGPLLEGGRDLPEEAKNLLVFELTDLPSDMSRFRLREPVSYLRARARALLARTGFEATDLDIYKELGFHGVSVDVADYKWHEARILKAFERFVDTSETLRLQSFAHSLRSKSLVVAAVASGFRYMDGEAISEPLDSPKRLRAYEIDMLYQ